MINHDGWRFYSWKAQYSEILYEGDRAILNLFTQRVVIRVVTEKGSGIWITANISSISHFSNLTLLLSTYPAKYTELAAAKR